MWVVTYDVAEDDRRRTAVRSWLAAWGERILRSGFLLEVGEGEMGVVMEGLRRRLGPRDHLLAAPTCGRCVVASFPRTALGGLTLVGPSEPAEGRGET